MANSGVSLGEGATVWFHSPSCHRIGQEVQGWAADDRPTDAEFYEPLTCIGCGRVHLINPKSGQVLEAAERRQRRVADGWATARQRHKKGGVAREVIDRNHRYLVFEFAYACIDARF